MVEQLLRSYKRMSLMQKLGFWGSVASIIGLAVTLFPPQLQSAPQTAQVTTYGNQSPAIGETHGDVNINYNSAPATSAKGYVLRNARGGAVLVVSMPSIEAAGDATKHVCMAVAGTPVTLLGEKAKMGTIEMWQKIQIDGGPCAAKVGWAAIENLSLE
jgi:hypothetical protein